MKLRSVMQHSFSRIPNAEIPRSSFDRSHGLKTTFDAGVLVPIFVDEVLPGDTFNLDLTAFARMATPIFPVMDNIFMETFFFFVPYRLVWDNWERFCGAQDDPGDSTDFLIPSATIPAGGFTVGTVADHFGLPLFVEGPDISALPFRAYYLIWNEWFRDQNLQNSVVIPTGNGPDAWGNDNPIRRCKRPDYFTSCLPWPQKGDSVPLPLGLLAPVTGLGFDYPATSAARSVVETGGATVAYPSGVSALDVTDPAGVLVVREDPLLTGPQVYADLSEATGSNINALRQAFQIQKMFERDARGGTRYIEVIKSQFGVTSPDQRLQRPEYLGGGSSMVNIAPVAQTSETDGTPQGNLSAIGTASLRGHSFVKSFVEHGVIIGMVNVRADLTYQQGLNRMWSRQTRFDHAWPALTHIGEQAVLNKEIFVAGLAIDEEVFGYQERFAEYRYKPSQITGAFRSQSFAPLDAWHLAQEFTVTPTLSSPFIQDNPPIDRVIAIPAEPHFLFDGYFKLRCARPLPLFGVPGMIDHF